MDIDEYNRQIVDSAGEFLEIAGEFIHGFKLSLSPKTVLRRFISHFGVTPRLCAILWIYCKDRMEEVGQKKHLLWVLNLLKTDSTEHALHGRWKADEKTIRKWVTLFIQAISELDVVPVIISHSMCMLFALKMVSNNVKIDVTMVVEFFDRPIDRLFFTD